MRDEQADVPSAARLAAIADQLMRAAHTPLAPPTDSIATKLARGGLLISLWVATAFFLPGPMRTPAEDPPAPPSLASPVPNEPVPEGRDRHPSTWTHEPGSESAQLAAAETHAPLTLSALPRSRLATAQAGPAVPRVPLRDPLAAAHRASRSNDAPRPLASGAGGGSAELRLLLQARRALEVTPTRALLLIEQHAREFPASAFIEEREALAIEALARASQPAEAKRRERTFEARFPHSAYLRRLASVLRPPIVVQDAVD
jgi:hypothetical protein